MKAKIFLNAMVWAASNPKKSKVIFWLIVICFPVTFPLLILGIIIIKLISPFLKKSKDPVDTAILEKDSSEDLARIIVLGIVGVVGAILWNKSLKNQQTLK